MRISPNVKNFVKSLREVGYNFEIAVADILDNCISAKAKEIHIDSLEDEGILNLTILDDGIGMNEEELINAMRLGSKDPEGERNSDDLGKFGLGLKTASFSQCKKFTVISKKDDKISALQWDLDYIIEVNDWIILQPEEVELEKYESYTALKQLNSGTLIVWESIDGVNEENVGDVLFSLRKHIALVFHRFLEGEYQKIDIFLNNLYIDPFNPFNEKNQMTQKLVLEKFKVPESTDFIMVQPYILPHHSKVSRYEYESKAGSEGYIKSQGFYLYRAGRLLINGTWWGLNKINEGHKLVRIKIDIPNNQDVLWNIDVKKSTANPRVIIKKELKRIIDNALKQGTKIYTERGKKLKNIENRTPIWKTKIDDNEIKFIINKEHPIYGVLSKQIGEEKNLFENYIKSVEAYLPIPLIHSHLVSNPQKIDQLNLISEETIEKMLKELKELNLPEETFKVLMESEIFKNRGVEFNE